MPGCASAAITTTTIPVVVTVEDTDGDPEEGLPVYAFDGASYSGYNETPDASGQAVFTLPQGDYRFRSDKNGTQFWSGEANHCTIPGCVSTTVTTTIPLTVTVRDTSANAENGLPVYAFDGASYSGYNKTTGADGQAVFTLPQGDYRFRSDKNGTRFWSSEANHCTLPGCASTTVTTTIPLTVTVKDTNGDPEQGLPVYAFDDTTYTGHNGTTDVSGTLTRTDYVTVTSGGGYTTTTRAITYTYDPLGRLVEADYSTGEQFEYQYDAVGNRTAMTSTIDYVSRFTPYEYDAANRLTSVDGVTYTWDARGNLTSDGTFTYTYNSAGRMVGAEGVTSTLMYTYSADGLRVAQVVDGVETTFAWDLEAGLPVVISDTKAMYLYALTGQALAEQRDGMWAYPLVDSLRNVRQWSSGDGEILGSVEYRPFGTPEGTAGTIASPYGYTGEYHEPETGLVYLRARHYAPALSRFLQHDPWEGDHQRPQTLNLYAYVENNAVNFTDRTGLCTSCRRGSTVEVRNANQYGGLAVRTEPDQNSRLLMRLPDGSRVVIADDFPVGGPGGYDWHSTYLSRLTGMILINYGRVWMANDWLYDIEPPGPPNPGPSPSPPTSDWVLPLDEPIKYWNGYGYYNWGAGTDGICHPCASYQQPELEHSDYTCNLCLHKGWDLTSLSSTNVYAMGDGTVLWRNDHILAISHVVNEQTIEVQYTHIEIGSDVGNMVIAGQKIGIYGAYGPGITWEHLDWTVKSGGHVVNPALYWPKGAPATFTGSWGNPICIPPSCP